MQEFQPVTRAAFIFLFRRGKNLERSSTLYSGLRIYLEDTHLLRYFLDIRIPAHKSSVGAKFSRLCMYVLPHKLD